MTALGLEAAKHPVMATPQNPNPPTVADLLTASKKNELAAVQCIVTARNMLQRFNFNPGKAAPAKEPSPALVGAAGEPVGAAS